MNASTLEVTTRPRRLRLEAGVLGNLLALAMLAAVAAVLAGCQVEAWHWQLPPAPRLWGAATLLAGQAALIGVFRPRRQPAADARASGGMPAPDPADADWVVAHASQTGQAEALARQAADALEDAGHRVALVGLSDLSPGVLPRIGRLLVVASTTGEGDPPDAAFGFVRHCMGAPMRLGGMEFGLLALGDRAYGEFCAFGKMLDDWFRQSGARPVFDAIEVDDHDPAALEQWRQALGRLGAVVAEPAAPQGTPHRWRLASRRPINTGSPGAEVFDLVLEPGPGTPVQWRAGDIAVVEPRGGPQVREYSIASTPVEGHLRLLVRRQAASDGTPGLGSGWLTAEVPVGGEVGVRIRTNTAFHAPADARPLLLVGNGTGIAGLRALVRERIERGHHRNWLLFGERSRTHDFHYREELERWHREQALERLDVVFSREPGDGRYVQHLVEAHGQRVREWVAAGAAIHVCGSLRGMAPGVHDALVALLGRTALESMAAQGRYRRDVY